MLNLLRGFALSLVMATSPAWAGSATLLGAGKPPVAAGGGCTEATTFLARTSGLDGTHTTAYTNLICGLVTDGVYSAFDALYIFATQDATTSLLSLPSATFNATAINAPGFTADRGYLAVATSTINSNFNPSTATSPQFVQNSAHMSVWNNTNTTNNAGVMGTAAVGFNFFVKFTDNNLYSRINDAVESSGYAIANPMGLLVGDRTSSTAIAAYQNGSSLGSASQTSQAVVNANIGILAFSAASSTDTAHQISAASIGRGLTSTEVSNFYSRMRTYMTAVGVP